MDRKVRVCKHSGVATRWRSKDFRNPERADIPCLVERTIVLSSAGWTTRQHEPLLVSVCLQRLYGRKMRYVEQAAA